VRWETHQRLWIVIGFVAGLVVGFVVGWAL